MGKARFYRLVICKEVFSSLITKFSQLTCCTPLMCSDHFLVSGSPTNLAFYPSLFPLTKCTQNGERRLRQRKQVAVPEKKRAPLPERPLQPLICECTRSDEEITAEAPKKPGVVRLCQAVERVSGQHVGCKNKAQDLKLRKSSAKAKGKILCAFHIQRLRKHYACAFCGDFCAHVSDLIAFSNI